MSYMDPIEAERLSFKVFVSPLKGVISAYNPFSRFACCFPTKKVQDWPKFYLITMSKIAIKHCPRIFEKQTKNPIQSARLLMKFYILFYIY